MERKGGARGKAARKPAAKKKAGKPKGGGKRQAKQGRAGNPDAEFLEGKHALMEALSGAVPVVRIYAAESSWRDKRTAEMLKRAAKRGIDVVKVDASKLDERSSHGAHQGIIAQVRPFAYCNVDKLVKAAHGKENALVIATDHVTDVGNFGAICRSAEVVGAAGVLVPAKRQAGVTVAAYKTSAGAVAHLPIAKEQSLPNALKRLKDEGFWVVGASERADTLLWDANLKGRIVLVMGSEGEGISEGALKACDALVALPQAGKVGSLNVAQATTAMAYEWMRQSR